MRSTRIVAGIAAVVLVGCQVRLEAGSRDGGPSAGGSGGTTSGSGGVSGGGTSGTGGSAGAAASGGSAGAAGASGSAGAAGASGSAGAAGAAGASGTAGAAGAGGCAPGNDVDGDGFTTADGDCNDCDPNVNPGAWDFPGNGIDEDCSGTADDGLRDCDTSLAVDSTDPKDGARAIGLCHFITDASDKRWGVIDAKYVMADGTAPMNDIGHGILPDFGTNVVPRQGASMLALSSGTARRPTDPGWSTPSGYAQGTSCNTPPGYPMSSPACGSGIASDTTARDPAALELTIRTPTNVKSFAFGFVFYTYEFPSYVCSQYNDFFVTLQAPVPANALAGNICFDNQDDPIGVNTAFVEVCTPQVAGGKNFTCPQGTAMLDGTGFEGHAASGWLQTLSAVTPGTQVTLRFAIWDMGDEYLDSLVLVDDFKWSTDTPDGPRTTKY